MTLFDLNESHFIPLQSIAFSSLAMSPIGEVTDRDCPSSVSVLGCLVGLSVGETVGDPCQVGSVVASDLGSTDPASCGGIPKTMSCISSDVTK